MLELSVSFLIWFDFGAGIVDQYRSISFSWNFLIGISKWSIFMNLREKTWVQGFGNFESYSRNETCGIRKWSGDDVNVASNYSIYSKIDLDYLIGVHSCEFFFINSSICYAIMRSILNEVVLLMKAFEMVILLWMPFNVAIQKFLRVTQYLSAGSASSFLECLIQFIHLLPKCYLVTSHFRFVPPDNFKLALLTLELEFVKGKTNRTEQVRLFLEILIINVICAWELEVWWMNTDCFAVRCCCSSSTTSKKIYWPGKTALFFPLLLVPQFQCLCSLCLVHSSSQIMWS